MHHINNFRLLQTMKRLTIIIFAISCALCSFCQTRSLLDYSEIALGKKADGSSLMFHFIPTDGKLKGFGITEKLPYLIISDKAGNHLFNLETYQEIANIKKGNNNFAQINNDGYLLISKGAMFTFKIGCPSFYNFNGEKIWSTKDEAVLADRKNNVVICSQNRAGDAMVGYDMSTGRELWHVKIPFKKHYPWGGIFNDKEDRRMYYLMSDSLIRLNIVTGDTIRHSFSAGVKEPMKSRFTLTKMRKPSSAAFAREMAFSAVTGAILTGTHSNIVAKGDSLFVADAENVYCFDKSLKTIWQTAIPQGMGAKSDLQVKDGKVCLQNYGVAFQNGIIGRCGKPFFASYDRNTGRQLAFDVAGIEKKIVGGIHVEGRTFWQTDKAFLYTDDGDSIAHEIKWKAQTDNLSDEYYPDYVICDTVGIIKDGSFQYLISDKDQLLVEVYGKDINIIRPDGNCTLLPASEAFRNRDGNVYYTNNGSDAARDFVVVDPETQKIKYTFHILGNVRQDDKGNLFVFTKQGIGFLPSCLSR